MRPASFEYVRPPSTAEACRALADGGTALAGGQSLLPLLKLRAVRPALVVDLNRITELQGIGNGEATELAIGAMTRHQHVADDPVVASAVPLLAEAARRTGDMQVRARGTIGGNVCFADPRANMSTALVALGAVAVVERTAGSRQVPVAEMFSDTRVSALRPGELLTRLHVPLGAGADRGVYLEFAPQPNGVPIVNVAVVPGDGELAGPRIAVGGLLRTTCRATQVEKAVRLEGATSAAIRRGIEGLLADHEGYADPRGDTAYRARLASVLIGRGLERAARGPRTTEREV
ncbi:MAG: xanthine dehydrogenase family protein subunit M [Streptosporangiales bacterium]|nr:xanthine dehydrogenase family protein subunit M [Streptosporangiales bacterium]